MRESMKLYASMPCVGVKSTLFWNAAAELLFRDGVIGIPWHSILGATVDFMSKGKQPEVDGGEGVKSSNIMVSLPKAISKSMGCCGVEFLGGGVKAS